MTRWSGYCNRRRRSSHTLITVTGLWLYPWHPTWPTAKSYFRSRQFQTAPIQTSGGTVSQNSHSAEQQLLENHTIPETIPNSLCAYAHLANKVRSDDVQTWMIKQMFGMEQNLGLTNKGIKLHFWWQTDSMNLWTDSWLKNSIILKKIIYWEYFITVRWKHSG